MKNNYSWPNLWLLAIIILIFLDSLTTWIGLPLGAVEYNPVAKLLMKQVGIGITLWIFKPLMHVPVVVWLWLGWRKEIRTGDKRLKTTFVVAPALFALLFYVVADNALVIWFYHNRPI